MVCLTADVAFDVDSATSLLWRPLANAGATDPGFDNRSRRDSLPVNLLLWNAATTRLLDPSIGSDLQEPEESKGNRAKDAHHRNSTGIIN